MHASSLASSMQPVIDAVGYDAAIAIVSRWGGVTVTLRAQPHCPIPQVLGVDAARKLESALGPGSLAVPRCMAWLLARRNEEIATRYAYGETQAELALRFGLTDRQIRRILGSEPDPAVAAPAPDLFRAEEGAAS